MTLMSSQMIVPANVAERRFPLPAGIAALERHGWTVTESGCWEWNGYRKKRDGYGEISFGGNRNRRRVGAHVLAYEMWVGPIDGYNVCHRCDNPPCINPDHLFRGTQTDNLHDMVSKGRNVPPPALNGALNHNAVLTAEDIPVIRARVARGDLHREIAADYGVHKAQISSIITGRTWRHA